MPGLSYFYYSRIGDTGGGTTGIIYDINDTGSVTAVSSAKRYSLQLSAVAARRTAS